MTMIEKVARALADLPEAQESDTLYYPFEKRPEGYLALARAAIEAMREPTGAMIAVVVREVYPNDQGFSEWEADSTWGAMIEAALTEPRS